jgi:5-methylcytosine-specific restriction protein A
MAWEASGRKERLPPDWPAIRRRVLRVHGGRCHVCGMGGSDAVDHVRAGDDHSLANLAPIHQDVAPYCHRAKSALEGVAAREALRAQRLRPREAHPGMSDQ